MKRCAKTWVVCVSVVCAHHVCVLCVLCVCVLCVLCVLCVCVTVCGVCVGTGGLWTLRRASGEGARASCVVLVCARVQDEVERQETNADDLELQI